MDETTKDDDGIARPAFSAPVLAIFGAGFHPIGQNGLRSFTSTLKEDYVSILSARSRLPAKCCCRSLGKGKAASSFPVDDVGGGKDDQLHLRVIRGRVNA